MFEARPDTLSRMTTFEQIETLIPRLTQEERARLATILFPLIQKTSGVNGGAANIGQTRIAVWMLEAARREGLSDGRILEMYPTLSVQDLEEAWRYVEANKAEIEREIRENEEAI